MRSFPAHWDKFTTQSVSEVKDMNLIKMINHIENNKNLLHFMHRCYYVGDMWWYLKPTLKQKNKIAFVLLFYSLKCVAILHHMESNF